MDDVPQDPDQLGLFDADLVAELHLGVELVADLVSELVAALPEPQRERVLDQIAREA